MGRQQSDQVKGLECKSQSFVVSMWKKKSCVESVTSTVYILPTITSNLLYLLICVFFFLVITTFLQFQLNVSIPHLTRQSANCECHWYAKTCFLSWLNLFPVFKTLKEPFCSNAVRIKHCTTQFLGITDSIYQLPASCTRKPPHMLQTDNMTSLIRCEMSYTLFVISVSERRTVLPVVQSHTHTRTHVAPPLSYWYYSLFYYTHLTTQRHFSTDHMKTCTFSKCTGLPPPANIQTAEFETADWWSQPED